MVLFEFGDPYEAELLGELVDECCCCGRGGVDIVDIGRRGNC